MAGSRRQLVQHNFYCINCGKQGIPVWRKTGKLKGKNHRKALYCTNCKQTINHIEIITQEDLEQFKKDFAEGRYATEAAKSIEYDRNRPNTNRCNPMRPDATGSDRMRNKEDRRTNA